MSKAVMASILLGRYGGGLANQFLDKYVNFRHNDGFNLSDRIWRIQEYTQKGILDITIQGIMSGISAVELAEQLEGFLLKRGPAWTTGIKRSVTGKGTIAYNALRLARTEINQAYHWAQKEMAVNNPMLIGQKWNLSNSHPTNWPPSAAYMGYPEICDYRAHHDHHGLGEGVFPPGEAPPDHPNGLCYLTDVWKPVEEILDLLEESDYTDEIENWEGTSVPKKTLERAMHDPDYLSQSLSVHGDIVLQDMAKEVGFDKKPTLLSKEEMDAYIQQGNRELLRGIAGREGKAEAYVEQFKTGEYFAGKGVYGNGIYTAYGEDGFEVAKQFAGGVEKNVLRMALKKDAKIILHDALIEMQKLEFTALQEEERALRRKARREADRIYDETGDDDKVEEFLKEAAKKWEEMERYRQVLADPGRYALYKGYDAIDIPSSRFMVVLNRGKVFVQK